MTESSVWNVDPEPRAAASPEAFVDDLRRYVVHKSLNAVLVAAGSGVEPTGRTLSIPVSVLRAWGEWSPAGHAFLDTLRNDETLERALAPYPTHLASFYAWLGTWQAAVHRGALEELADLQRGFREPDVSVVLVSSGDDHATVPASWLRPGRRPQMAS